MIQTTKRNLDENKEVHYEKSFNYKGVLKNLKIEIKKMNEILLIQKQGKKNIDSVIVENSLELQKKKQLLEEKNKKLETDNRNEKHKTHKEIGETEEKESLKIKKEHSCIKIILGLHVLQK